MTPEDRAELERWRTLAAATPGRTARTLLDACNATEALDQENARLTYQRDQAREATDRNDAFVNELCTLIPDDRDDVGGAEAIITGWVKELLARLKAAEDVAIVFGWMGIDNSERHKAASVLYGRWIDTVDLEFAGPRAHPDLDTAALAREYDETRARTLAKIRADAPTELPGSEG